MIQDLAYKANDVISLGVVLAFKTGLRAGELAALSWDCVTADCLRIRKMEIKYFGDDGKEVYEVVDSTKTEAGERDVIIPFPLLTKKYFENLETLENTGRKERLHGFIF